MREIKELAEEYNHHDLVQNLLFDYKLEKNYQYSEFNRVQIMNKAYFFPKGIILHL